MRYKVTFDECPHCKDISDGRELEEHIANYQHKLKANAKLGLVFLLISLLIAILLIAAML